jgi:hypothetical protein
MCTVDSLIDVDISTGSSVAIDKSIDRVERGGYFIGGVEVLSPSIVERAWRCSRYGAVQRSPVSVHYVDTGDAA